MPTTENLYRDVVSVPLKHLCYAALADLFRYLPLSKAHPEDVAIRQKLQIAAWMSLWPQKVPSVMCVSACFWMSVALD